MNYLIKNNNIKYHRFLYKKILNSNSKFSGVYGSRGVSKTTLLLQVAKSFKFKNDKILYMSCDHPHLADVSLFELTSEFVKYGRNVYL